MRKIDEQLEHKVPRRMMVELPVNYDKLVADGKARKDTFFDTIASNYRQRGATIIYGDKELVLPNRSLNLVEVLFPEYFFDSDERDKFMIRRIR